MYTQSEIHSLVDALPAPVLNEFRMLNAQFDILCEADEKTQYLVPVLGKMQDQLTEKFSMLFDGLLAGLPIAIREETPTADGEYLVRDSLERILRRL